MKEDKPKLSIVSADTVKKEVEGIQDTDIADINVDRLRETMLKNIYVVEAALFQQAGFEYKRVNNIRSLISTLEGELFNEQVLAQLTPDQKIKLYNNLTHNMGKSLEFLSHLHDNVTSGIDTLNKIEKLKTEADAVKKSDEKMSSKGTAIEDVKKMIMNKIKERTTK